MRLNKYIAHETGLSRRAADEAIKQGRVAINGHTATLGTTLNSDDAVTLDGKPITPAVKTLTILFNKPAGYVVSRQGQGSKTIYDLLPYEYHALKPVGRLDKYSSGLLVLTNDGTLAHSLTHPSFEKVKIYLVTLDLPLEPLHRQMIGDFSIQLEDGPSCLKLDRQEEGNDRAWIVTMTEGRNRQIRRTFAALGYKVVRLHRTQFGPYSVSGIKPGRSFLITDSDKPIER